MLKGLRLINILNIRMIRRSLGYRAPASLSINLYKALILPIILYSAPVWSPFTKIQIESIKRNQRNFTRYALHYPTINYKERCEYRYLNILHCFSAGR